MRKFPIWFAILAMIAIYVAASALDTEAGVYPTEPDIGTALSIVASTTTTTTPRACP